MELKLQWEGAHLAAFKRTDKALFRALSKSGGDAIRSARVESSRSIRARKRFKVARVNKALRLTFPKGVRQIDGLVWRMDVKGGLVPVADFPHKQTRGGVSVIINTGKRVLIKGAFEATMRSGHVGVFMRKGQGRLPIKELFTTKVVDVFQDKGFVPSVWAKAQATFASSFARLLPLELKK